MHRLELECLTGLSALFDNEPHMQHVGEPLIDFLCRFKSSVVRETSITHSRQVGETVSVVPLETRVRTD